MYGRFVSQKRQTRYITEKFVENRAYMTVVFVESRLPNAS